MRRLKFAVPVLILLGLFGCTPGDTLHIDDPLADTFRHAYESYTFTAADHDRLRVRLLRTRGTFQPQVIVLNPAGTQVCGGSTSGELLDIPCGPLVAGRHTFEVHHVDPAVSCCDFTLYIQRIVNGPSSGAFADGQTRSGVIAEQLDSEVFTFNATDNDLVRIRARRGGAQSEPNFYPRVTVHNSIGTQVCSGSAPPALNFFFEFNCALAAGQHWIIVDDADGKDTGGYQLHLRRLRNPAGAMAITYGNTRSGSIDQPLETDPFTFTATTGDFIRLTLQAQNGYRVTVHNPVGAQVCSATSSGLSVQVDCPNPLVSGQHSILVDHASGGSGSNYDLTLTHL
jgi:hypothetical protein